jgi:hypothetical protein
MELMELQDLVVVQEQMVLMEVVEHQLHQGVVVPQGLLVQVGQVGQVDVMVQKVHQEAQEQVLHQQVQELQQAQELLHHLEAQDYLAIDIEHLLQLSSH